MDDEAKERFRWKFYGLTVLLNMVILSFALAVMALIWGGDYAVPVFAVLVVAGIVLAFVFLKKYRKEKAWLMTQS
ncbi:MAG: hypothetical protein GXY82_06335 [Methanospirillum sp.]|nr:hypothetical protein [Methanospirillum sp.]